MQRRTYITLGRILSARWLMDNHYAQAYFPAVFGMMQGLKPEEMGDVVYRTNQSAANVYYVSEYGEAAPVAAAPKNSVAVISLNGPVTKEDQFCGNAGTLTKAAQLSEAIANPNIIGVILSIDSGGGEAGATEFFANQIKASTKPVVAYVNGMAASAAYWIASACRQIVIDGQTSEVGSIGTYTQLADFTRYYKEQGVDLHTIYAPQSNLKNRAFRDAQAGDYQTAEQDLQKFTEFFIAQVKANRGDLLSDNRNIFKGAMYYAEDAIANGLADVLGTFEDAVAIVEQLATDRGSESNQSTRNSTDMKIKVLHTQAALITALGVSFAAEQTEMEHDLTEENLQSLVSALENANATQATVQAELTTAQEALASITQERDAAIADAAEWKAKAEANAGPTNVIAAEKQSTGAKGIDAYADQDADYIQAAKAMFSKPE